MKPFAPPARLGPPDHGATPRPAGPTHARGTDPATLAGLASGALALLLYLATTHPQVAHHDAAEFQTLAATGGIAHAGYPAVVMLLQALGRLPVSTFALRANLLSCLAGALAVGLSAFGGVRLTGSSVAGTLGALGLALSLTLWNESTLAGAHAFTLALDAALYLLCLKLAARPSRALASGIGVLGGLGLISHLTVLSVAPVGLAALGLAARTGRLRAGFWIAGLAGLLAGLAPLAYMLAQDRPDGPMNYIAYTLDLESGQYFPAGTAALSRLERAAWLLSARQLTDQPTFRPFADAARRLRFLALDLGLNEFPLWGVLLAALGGVWMLGRRRREAGLLLLWMLATVFWLLLAAGRTSITVFFLPGLWALSQAVAAGIAALGTRGRARPWMAGLLLLAAPWVRLAVAEPPARLARFGAVAEAWEQWPRRWSPLRADPSWERYGRGVMAALPPRALVLSCWNEGTTLRYCRYAEGLRPDVELLMTCSHARRVQRALERSRGEGRPAFATFDPARAASVARGTRVAQWERGALWRLEALAP